MESYLSNHQSQLKTVIVDIKKSLDLLLKRLLQFKLMLDANMTKHADGLGQFNQGCHACLDVFGLNNCVCI